MKNLDVPNFDDRQALENISNRHQNRSLVPHIEKITDSYKAYVKSKGNIRKMDVVGLPNPVKSKLLNMYKNPPRELQVFRDIRDTVSPDVCPMCGSFGSGTLDHVFPKTTYHEFSVFTKNLVPACNCNTNRGSNSIGVRNGERVLHPYFDPIMSHRLLRTKFIGEFPYPKLDIEVCYSGTGRRAVEYHLKEIVKKNKVIEFQNKYWATIHRKPYVIISGLPKTTLSAAQLKDYLERVLLSKDEEFETRNNWHSMMFCGILSSPEAMEHLLRYLNRIVRGEITPDQF